MTIKVYNLNIPDNTKGETLTLAQITGLFRGLAPNIPITADAAHELGITDLLGDVIGEANPNQGENVTGNVNPDSEVEVESDGEAQ